MKKIIFSCDGDGCKRTTTGDVDEWLSIGAEEDEAESIGLFIKNGLPERRLISLDRHSAIHFCSKECFYNYFFKLDGRPLTAEENICGVARPSDRELLRRAISNARPSRGEVKVVRWGCVMRVFGVGSTTAHILCREAGLDPEDLLDGTRCEDCPVDVNVSRLDVAKMLQEARNRATNEPGGMECQECGAIFIGAEWHTRCGICEALKQGGDAVKQLEEERKIPPGALLEHFTI